MMFTLIHLKISLISVWLQFLAAFVVSYIAVMAVIGSNGYLPVNLGTPGLVCPHITEYTLYIKFTKGDHLGIFSL